MLRLKDQIKYKQGIFRFQAARIGLVLLAAAVVLFLSWFVFDSGPVRAWGGKSILNITIDDVILLMLLSRLYKLIFD